MASRDEAVSQAMTSLQSSFAQAIGVAFDAGVNSVDQSGNGKQFAQSDIDAAVSKVTKDDAEHMADLQKHIDLDADDLAKLKSSISEMLSKALSALSPGPDASATQQVPGQVPSSASGANGPAAQAAGPAPDVNDGTNQATAR